APAPAMAPSRAALGAQGALAHESPARAVRGLSRCACGDHAPRPAPGARLTRQPDGEPALDAQRSRRLSSGRRCDGVRARLSRRAGDETARLRRAARGPDPRRALLRSGRRSGRHGPRDRRMAWCAARRRRGGRDPRLGRRAPEGPARRARVFVRRHRTRSRDRARAPRGISAALRRAFGSVRTHGVTREWFARWRATPWLRRLLVTGLAAALAFGLGALVPKRLPDPSVPNRVLAH